MLISSRAIILILPPVIFDAAFMVVSPCRRRHAYLRRCHDTYFAVAAPSLQILRDAFHDIDVHYILLFRLYVMPLLLMLILTPRLRRRHTFTPPPPSFITFAASPSPLMFKHH